jgi:N-acetylneuraminic acid mutarotase
MFKFILLLFFTCSFCKVQWIENNPDHEPLSTLKSDAHPIARANHAAFCYMDDLFIFGGKSSGGRLNDFWTYQPDTARWLWLSDGPGPQGRDGMSYWLLDGKFWVYGGETDTVGSLDDFWVYTPSTRQWNPQTNVNGPGKRWNSAFWTDLQSGRLFLYGGKVPNTLIENGPPEVVGDLWHYDTKTHTWHAHPESNDPGVLEDAVAIQIEDIVYLFGGSTHATNGDVTNKLWKLDINTLIWIEQEIPEGAKWPQAREKHILIATPSKDKLIVMLGKHNNKLFNGMWQMDLETHEWEEKSGGLPSSRFGAAYCINDEGNTFLNGGSYNSETFSNDVWQYGDRPTFAALQSIFEFDLNYTNVALSYVVAMVSILMFFAIAFSITACIVHYRKKRDKKLMPIQPVEDF